MLSQIFPSIPAILSLTLLGLAFGLILSIAKLKLKVHKDPRIEAICDALPGANCGACGLPGCSGYASKIVLEGMDINKCPVGGASVIIAIASIMGVEASGGASEIARIHCQGGQEQTMNRYSYNGPKNCIAAHALAEGFKICEYGCLGLGTCAQVCPFDAISMSSNGLPVVDKDKCTACGLCVEACPRDIITLEDKETAVYVMCMNREKAPVMKLGCSVGCIGCKLCVKACRQVHEDNPDIDTAIDVIDFLAIIDYDKCIDCGKCAEACKKQNVISFVKEEVKV